MKLFTVIAGVGLVLAVGSPQTRAAESSDDWYVFKPTDTTRAGAVGLADWSPQRAGSRGWITTDGGALVVDGEPIKLWGLNLTYMYCAPQKELADQRAAWYAKMGFNSLRQHKYANGAGWRGICADDSWVTFNAEKLDRFDYFNAKLIEHGLYIKLSPSFGVRLGKADRQYLPEYYDEISEGGKKDWPRVPYGAVYYLPEMQQATIDQLVNILEHTNPYTGKKYKDDPAIAFVEAINEDSALWYGNTRVMERSPFIRKRSGELFSAWLKEKYGSQEALVEAWGDDAITPFDELNKIGVPEESLEQKTFIPYGHSWWFDPKSIRDNHPHLESRMFDTMRFLYDRQNLFYDKFAEAMRATGYGGLVIGSNWQAGRMTSHFYNLHSDARQDVVDRHNYFGGGRDGNIQNASMLAQPGSGTLSVGLQQVEGKPFMLSEWIHVWPNEWGGEGIALIGAYGMGLQGWDVSYLFQNRDDGGFSDMIGDQNWDITAPQLALLYPAIARQVRRGDVEPAVSTLVRHVDIENIRDNPPDFEEFVTQQHDIKTFDGDKVPAAALAVSQATIAFTDASATTPTFQRGSHADGQTLVSDTGQLRWTPAPSGEKVGGVISIDTPGTQAVVGFADGTTHPLTDVTVSPAGRFTAVYVSALEEDGTIADAASVLVTLVGRARNTGQQINAAGDRLEAKGEPPVRLEPVAAELKFTSRTPRRIVLLDHDGLPTGHGRSLDGDVVRLDTAVDPTPYFLIQFD
jgi:hypothetical protein